MNRKLASLLIVGLVVLSLVACKEEQRDEIGGTITVITNRTDLIDTKYAAYEKAFKEKYPEVEDVVFEAITDYEETVKTRLSAGEYGDVLMLPAIDADEFEVFFEPLGTVEELGEKYNFVNTRAYDGQVYGIPTGGKAAGIVYNKAVFEDSRITEIPATPESFIEALKKIDTSKTVPMYTNYAAGWPLTQWQDNLTSIAGDEDYKNNTMVTEDNPFAEGKPAYVLYKLMYDVVKEGLSEADPTTTDWELSKQMMADGEIATMVLGSWAISQIQALAEDPDDIGYMPFPYTNEDGHIYSLSSGDYTMGISVNSNNKITARAWIDFFADESGYAASEGFIPPLKTADLPSNLSAFQDLGVVLINENPGAGDLDGLFDELDNESEIGFWTPDFKQRLIDAARGQTSETLSDIFNELNDDWNDARA